MQFWTAVRPPTTRFSGGYSPTRLLLSLLQFLLDIRLAIHRALQNVPSSPKRAFLDWTPSDDLLSFYNERSLLEPDATRITNMRQLFPSLAPG